MHYTLTALVALSVFWGSNAFAQSAVASDRQTYKVINVVDGDTLDVLVAGQFNVRLRLNGIDCPEQGQPFGNNAKAFVSKFVRDARGQVRVKVTGLDKYRRHLADISAGGKSLNAALIDEGLAWHYIRFNQDPGLAAKHASARAAKRGLWSDPRHVAPWEWRDLSKVQRDQLR